MKTEVGVVLSHTRNNWGPQKLEEVGRILLYSLRRERGLADTLISSSGL